MRKSLAPKAEAKKAGSASNDADEVLLFSTLWDQLFIFDTVNTN